MTSRAEKRRDIEATAVAAALSRVIELTDAGAPPKKRAAARAHAEALCRRWKLSLREEQAALGRSVDMGSMTEIDMAPTAYDRNRNIQATLRKM